MQLEQNKLACLRRLPLRLLVLLKAAALCVVMTPTLIVTCEVGLCLKPCESGSEAPLEEIELLRDVTPSQLSRRASLGRSHRSVRIEPSSVLSVKLDSGYRTPPDECSTPVVSAGLCSRLRC